MPMMRDLSLIAISALLTTVSARPAAAAPVLCQKKSGAIVVHEGACKKKETAFDLSPFVSASSAFTDLGSQVGQALHGTVVVTQAGMTGANMMDTELTVGCPTGYQATGGGTAGTFNRIGVDASGPTIGGQPTNSVSVGTAGPADGWFVRVYSFNGTAEPFNASVVCVKPGP
jgi:hypothetical protein